LEDEEKGKKHADQMLKNAEKLNLLSQEEMKQE